MKTLATSLLVLAGIILFTTGCREKSEDSDLPTTEHPEQEAPKDHPAH